jgi:hypothetical protein
MKQLFSCFFYFILFATYPVVAHSVLEKASDPVFVLMASVIDSYEWSEAKQKYSLRNSEFTFQVRQKMEGDSPSDVVHRNSIRDTPNRDVRYLSVSSPEVVYFESVVSSVWKKMVVKAKMFEEKERLFVYFSKERKSNILNNMLLAAGVNFSVQENQGTSSDYYCNVNQGLLVCSISYMKKGQFSLDE